MLPFWGLKAGLLVWANDEKKMHLGKDYQLHYEPKGTSVLWTVHLLPACSGHCSPVLFHGLCHCFPPAIITPLLLSVVCRHFSLPTFFLLIFGSSPPPPLDFEHQKSIPPPYNPGTWAFTLLHWAPGTLSAFSHTQGRGQERLWLQRRSSTLQETVFLPFMLADGMICMEKMESLMEQCGKSGCTSTPRLSITIRMMMTEPALGTKKAGRSQTCSNGTLFFFSFQ